MENILFLLREICKADSGIEPGDIHASTLDILCNALGATIIIEPAD